jgi:hypothetical protein
VSNSQAVVKRGVNSRSVASPADDVLQVADRAGEAIDPGDHKHVAGPNAVEDRRKLRSPGPGANAERGFDAEQVDAESAANQAPGHVSGSGPKVQLNMYRASLQYDIVQSTAQLENGGRDDNREFRERFHICVR